MLLLKNVADRKGGTHYLLGQTGIRADTVNGDDGVTERASGFWNGMEHFF